jgi:hypothetical protein
MSVEANQHDIVVCQCLSRDPGAPVTSSSPDGAHEVLEESGVQVSESPDLFPGHPTNERPETLKEKVERAGAAT